jgi:PAS domain S-box-containing protein
VAKGSSTMSEIDAWLAHAVVTESAEAIVVTDPDGIIRLWNNGAARVFGYSAAEAVGQSLDLIIPEKLRDRHWKGYRETMATGITRYGDKLLSVPATHQDGRRLSIEFSVALLRDETGQITGISAIMREVTERREAEKALRAKLAELETRAGPA